MIPEQINDAIKVACAEYDVDLKLIRAIIKTESNFNPWVDRYEEGFYNRYVKDKNHWVYPGITRDTEERDRATSYGLMQIMGQCAREVGYRHLLPRLFIPEVNLKYGIRLWKLKLQRAAGDVREGLLGWNGRSNKKYPDIVFGNMEG